MLRALLQVPRRSRDEKSPSVVGVRTPDVPLDVPEGLPRLQYACIHLGCFAGIELAEGLLEIADDIREGPANGPKLDFSGVIDMHDPRYYSKKAAEEHWLDLLNGGDGPWCLPSK